MGFGWFGCECGVMSDRDIVGAEVRGVRGWRIHGIYIKHYIPWSARWHKTSGPLTRNSWSLEGAGRWKRRVNLWKSGCQGIWNQIHVNIYTTFDFSVLSPMSEISVIGSYRIHSSMSYVSWSNGISVLAGSFIIKMCHARPQARMVHRNQSFFAFVKWHSCCSIH